jgi:serine/threonine protein kinase
MLTSGAKLGTYEVTGHVGSGGMGEVYQAHDTKLGRDVAIKVLPEQFARDPERLARFQREAKLLAALNHPNIATIHGLEQSGDTHYLVMELVPGETLRDRILRDGALPVEEALKISKQIAEALEAAHEKGIIHRDLKPANVKVTPEDRVKVLDFGLAKAFSAEPSSADVANSPTLSMNATTQGVIMGTAAYMSPEQAKGKAVNKATDIFAFGSVLYEMLTGKQCFSGEDVGDILATVVKSDPNWSELPADMPLSIKTLLRRCLRKDRQQRLQDAATLRIEIDDALSGSAVSESVAISKAQTMSTAKSRVFSWAAAFALGLVVATAIANLWKPSAVLSPLSVTRLNTLLPSGEHIPLLNTNVVAISPDGSQMAFVSIHEGKQQIYLRPFASEEAKPLAGTDGAENLFSHRTDSGSVFSQREG